MRVKFFSVGVIASALVCGISEAASAQTPPIPASISGQHITIVGTLKRVETGPRRVLFTGDDGQSYTLDISKAKITLPVSGNANGLSGLKPGMRAYVSGEGSTGENIVVGRFQVLPPAAAAHPDTIPTVTDTGNPPDLTVRGTVEVLDFEQGSFILRINTHTRIVYITADTDISGLGPAAANHFPVQPGQRVTVGGSLQPNGTLLAGLLTLKGDPDYRTPPNKPDRVLIGAVSSAPNKLRSRDFRIRAADGTETKLQVPRGIPIRRGGRSISVYDLNSRDEVRVTGRMTDSEFHAARVDVLAPPPNSLPTAVPASAPLSSATPTRPGL